MCSIDKRAISRTKINHSLLLIQIRLYIPRETCVITFLLSGVSCPRGDRNMPGGVFQEGEPFGNEATAFIKEQIMQKEVEIEVETMDKGKYIFRIVYQRI